MFLYPCVKVLASNERHGACAMPLRSDGGEFLRLNPTTYRLPTDAAKRSHIRHCQQDLLADALAWLGAILSVVGMHCGGSHSEF